MFSCVSLRLFVSALFLAISNRCDVNWIHYDPNLKWNLLRSENPFIKQRRWNPCELKTRAANSIHTVRLTHSLTVELREKLTKENRMHSASWKCCDLRFGALRFLLVRAFSFAFVNPPFDWLPCENALNAFKYDHQYIWFKFSAYTLWINFSSDFDFI